MQSIENFIKGLCQEYSYNYMGEAKDNSSPFDLTEYFNLENLNIFWYIRKIKDDLSKSGWSDSMPIKYKRNIFCEIELMVFGNTEKLIDLMQNIVLFHNTNPNLAYVYYTPEEIDYIGAIGSFKGKAYSAKMTFIINKEK